jgi:hypothetical protein
MGMGWEWDGELTERRWGGEWELTGRRDMKKNGILSLFCFLWYFAFYGICSFAW